MEEMSRSGLGAARHGGRGRLALRTPAGFAGVRSVFAAVLNCVF
jgi:hypothetical protein